MEGGTVNLSIGLLTLCLFGSMIALMLTGLPITFGLAGIAILFTFFLWGPASFFMVVTSFWNPLTSFILIALPLFVLMANIMQRSGVTEALYSSLHLWFGPIRGGLAIATLIICSLMAAMVGIIGAGIVSMTIIALPAMLNRKYDKKLALGSIMAGGSLGVLIPPSVLMMIYAAVVEESIGKMFAGGVFPGLILTALYIIYASVRCALKPELGPPLPPEERGTLKQKFVSIRSLILPVGLIFAVLGTIFLGIATPTEAASVGVLGAIISAAIYRKLNWPLINEALYSTLKVHAMIIWIICGAKLFSSFYVGMGASTMIENMVIGLGANRWVIILAINVLLVIMGMFMDDTPIVMIAAPIFSPIVALLGFDTLWFAIIFIINLQISVLTPPYGLALFYVKGVLPEESFGTLYRAIIPFTILQVIGLTLCMIFPQIILWLPSVIIH